MGVLALVKYPQNAVKHAYAHDGIYLARLEIARKGALIPASARISLVQTNACCFRAVVES
jgi:hypothetical protein